MKEEMVSCLPDIARRSIAFFCGLVTMTTSRAQSFFPLARSLLML